MQRHPVKHSVMRAGLLALLLLVGLAEAAAAGLNAPHVSSTGAAQAKATATFATAAGEDPAPRRAVVPGRALPLPVFVERELTEGPADAPSTAVGSSPQATGRIAHAAPRAATNRSLRRGLRASRLHLYCVYRL